MKLKLLVCVLYFTVYSECFTLERENKLWKRSPTEIEDVNYSNGQSDVSRGALTLTDVEEAGGRPSPLFTIKEKRCPRNGNVVGAVYQPVAASQITRRDLQSAVNKRMCDACRLRKACTESDNCDYCARWCENREKEETTGEREEPLVGQTENGAETVVSMSSRFGDATVGQAIDVPTAPKFYVLGRLDSIMAIEIISKILGVQNPGDIKQLLILASTKSDNPPAFGPSMHNISPEKAMVLTHALNNELDKLRSERPDGVLSNEELNRALERAIEGLESNTLVGGEKKDEETVACSKEIKNKEEIVPVYPMDGYYRDAENEVGAEVTDAPEGKSADGADETVACSKEKKMKEDIVPIYPFDSYASSYRHDDAPNVDEAEVKNPEVIEDTPELPVGANLEGRMNEEAVAGEVVGENGPIADEIAEDVVSEPHHHHHKKVPSKHHHHHLVDPSTSDQGEKVVGETNPTEDGIPEGLDAVPPTNQDIVSEPHHHHHKKFPSKHHLVDSSTAEQEETVVAENNPTEEVIAEESDAVPLTNQDIVSEPHHHHHHDKFHKKHPPHHEHYSPQEHYGPSHHGFPEHYPHGGHFRSEAPHFEDKFQPPSAAHMSDDVRQVTLPLTTERILGEVPEEEGTLHMENERPMLESANHFGIPDEAPLLQENEAFQRGPVQESQPPLGGQIVDLVDSQIQQNEGNEFARNDGNSPAPRANLGRDIVKVVEENMQNPQIKELPKLVQDKVHETQENFKNFLHNLRLEQPDIFRQLQDHRNLENVAMPENVDRSLTVESAPEGPVIVPENTFQRAQPEMMEGPGITPELEHFGEGNFEPAQPEMVEQAPPFVSEEGRNNDLMSNVEQVEMEKPDMMESRMQMEEQNPAMNALVGHQQFVSDEVNSHFGKIVPAQGNVLEAGQQPNSVFFLGNGIKLPLRMRKNGDGSMDISVDLDKLCSCQNSTCPKFHNERIVETVGTILEKEAELKDQLESIDAGHTAQPETANVNNKQIRRDLNAVNDGNGAGEHIEMFKRASSPFIASSNAAKMSRFLSNDMLSTTPKYPTLSEIVQMRDMYKYKKLEDELKGKLQVLNKNVELYKDENTKLLSTGAQKIFRTNEDNTGVQKQMDIVNNVLGWMKNVALTNAN